MAPRAQREPRALPGFYSRLRRVVEDPRTPPSARAEDLLRYLHSQPGVKAEELRWTRLQELLEGRGEELVTREDLLAHLDRHPVRMTEILFSDCKRRAPGEPRRIDTPFHGGYTLAGGKNYSELLLVYLPNETEPTELHYSWKSQRQLGISRSAQHPEEGPFATW